jgi:hypothetical protein
MRVVTILIVSLIFLSSAIGGELSTLTLNTGPYECGYKHVNIHELLWTNEGSPIKIKGSIIWIGMDKGSTGDTMAVLYRASTGDVVNSFAWDRYRNPDGIHQVTKDFGQDYITIGTGDSLSLQYFCNAGPKHSNGHVQVWIWYLRD